MSGSFSGAEKGMWRVRGAGDKKNPYLGLGTSTGNSSAYRGNVTMDPSIRAIQEQSLAKSNNLYNSLGSQADSLLGNQSDYIKARVSPLESEYTARQGELERSLGQRGLGGSSFGQQSLDSFASEKQRELGNARAMATSDSLAQLANVRAQQANLAGMDLETAKIRFTQELQALGLGNQEIQDMTKTFEDQSKRIGGFQPYQSGHAGSGSGGIGGGSTPKMGG